MRPKPSDHLHHRVAELVESAQYTSKFIDWIVKHGEGPFARFIPDVLRFIYQNRVLSRSKIAQYAVLFRDDGPSGETLPVIVGAPDLQNLTTSYQRFLDAIAKSLPLEEVPAEAAPKIFIERLAEFIAAGDPNRPSGGGPPSSKTMASSSVTQTTVNSNQSGDTVVYCQGFFHSTAQGFGLSTPAVNTLSPGRYSFGIRKGSVDDFEGILWTCPATVRLNKP